MAPITRSRVYADVNAAFGPKWHNYGTSHPTNFLAFCPLTAFQESFKIDWSSPDRYEIVRRVGGGKYSEVCCFFSTFAESLYPFMSRCLRV